LHQYRKVMVLLAQFYVLIIAFSQISKLENHSTYKNHVHWNLSAPIVELNRTLFSPVTHHIQINARHTSEYIKPPLLVNYGSSIFIYFETFVISSLYKTDYKSAPTCGFFFQSSPQFLGNEDSFVLYDKTRKRNWWCKWWHVIYFLCDTLTCSTICSYSMR